MSATEKIKMYDTDGDGALTAEEYSTGAKTMFERLDIDKDGTLTRTEMVTGQQKLMKKPTPSQTPTPSK
jgi:Ca2+-binding EF-hand superfamily protein